MRSDLAYKEFKLLNSASESRWRSGVLPFLSHSFRHVQSSLLMVSIFAEMYCAKTNRKSKGCVHCYD